MSIHGGCNSTLMSPSHNVFFVGYQAAYCQLAFAGSTEHDPFASSIPDAKIYLATCLNKLSGNHPGKVSIIT